MSDTCNRSAVLSPSTLSAVRAPRAPRCYPSWQPSMFPLGFVSMDEDTQYHEHRPQADGTKTLVTVTETHRTVK